MTNTAPAAEFPRQYVAPDADFGTWAVAEPYFRELTERPLGNLAQVEHWLRDVSEIEACLDEEGTQRYTAMTCQTAAHLSGHRQLSR